MNDTEYDKIYCYPNSNVLINKLDIKDAEDLNTMERKLSTTRNIQIEQGNKKTQGSFDIKHLQAIHEFLFQDLYSWAGKFRTVDISKGNTLFCRAAFIESYLSDVILKLEKQNYLVNMKPDSFIKNAAFYFAEINGVHPYREGNGRTQRVFFRMLGRVAGYEIDFKTIDSKQMIEASVYSMMMDDNSKFEEMFEKITSPISKDAQLVFAEKILPPNHKALVLLKKQPSVLRTLSEAKKETGQHKTKSNKKSRNDFMK